MKKAEKHALAIKLIKAAECSMEIENKIYDILSPEYYGKVVQDDVACMIVESIVDMFYKKPTDGVVNIRTRDAVIDELYEIILYSEESAECKLNLFINYVDGVL